MDRLSQFFDDKYKMIDRVRVPGYLKSKVTDDL